MTQPTFQTNHQNQYRQPSQNFHSSNQQQQYFQQQSNNFPQQQYFGRGRGRGRFGKDRGRGRRNFQNNTFQNYTQPPPQQNHYNQPPPPPPQQQNQSGWRPFNPNNLPPGQNIPQNFDPRRLPPHLQCYCHTHGACSQTSNMCQDLGQYHNPNATFHNRYGGSTRNFHMCAPF